MTRKVSATQLASDLGISRSRAMEAVMKADLISAVQREIVRSGVTHAELAKEAGMARSTVTGVLSGSLQKVTVDRLLRLVDAAGLEARIRIQRAA